MADSSLRQYIDIVAVASIQTDLATQGLSKLIEHTEAHWFEYFVGALPYCCDAVDARDGVDAGAGPTILPAVGPVEWADSGGVPAAQPPTSSRGHSVSSRARGRGRGEPTPLAIRAAGTAPGAGSAASSSAQLLANGCATP